ncbi:hypothetical protein DFH09DRAFT_1155510 [Mycena vulgaris]|nr:hypothetical protein DFH09DRAFT_1155510 [Mycena vulgaris]
MQGLFFLITAAIVHGLAMASPHEIAGRATTFTIGAPLTLSFSLDPSLTETGSAVASAYAEFAQDCGADFAQVVQDMQALYMNFHDLEAPPDRSDNNFELFADEFPEYLNAKKSCDNAQFDLDDAVRDADAAARGTSTTRRAPATTIGGSGAQITSTGGPTVTSGQASPTQSTSDAIRHGPGVTFLLVGIALLFSQGV